MRPAIAVGVGAILLVFALALTAPAALLDGRIDALSAGCVRVASATGTVWRGAGELVLLPAGTRTPLSWRLEAWPLLRGEVHAAIALDAGTARSATLVYGSDRLELRNLDVSLPAQSVLLAVYPKTPFAAGGDLALHVETLVQDPALIETQTTLRWSGASVPGLPFDPRIVLGDLRVELTGRGAEISGPLRNDGGEVEISGQVRVAASGTVRLDATVRPRGTAQERAERIAAALATLGAPDGQGGYRMSWAGTWR
jgi:hypothetical protein